MEEKDLFASTDSWFEASGQFNSGQPDVRTSALYLGLQLEELAEKLEAALPGRALAAFKNELNKLANDVKKGVYAEEMARALSNKNMRKEMLDADMDLIWVTLGAAKAQAADVPGAYNEVARSNWSKFPGGVVTRDPVTGKVVKPPTYSAPDLTPFLWAEGNQ